MGNFSHIQILTHFLLAYFQKIKLGLSNHQSVCVCPPLIDFHEIWYGGNVIQGDLNAIVCNPSIILKLLRFKVLR
jgi:hypothetical protein